MVIGDVYGYYDVEIRVKERELFVIDNLLIQYGLLMQVQVLVLLPSLLFASISMMGLDLMV